MTHTEKIDIVGRGNVGTHLYNALGAAGHDVLMVDPHTLSGLRADARATLLCVSDRAIRETAVKAAALLPRTGLLAHTSGSTPLSAISDLGTRAGVFYPMQTFSKDVALDYARIPFFIEASDHEGECLLCHIASEVSRDAQICDSEKRKILHISSVFCCNFANHLWALADELLSEQGLDFNCMRPLLEETLRKTERNRPGEVQTGPAVRRDTPVIEEHLRMLAGHLRMRDVYATMSASIMHDNPAKFKNT